MPATSVRIWPTDMYAGVAPGVIAVEGLAKKMVGADGAALDCTSICACASSQGLSLPSSTLM